jgi:hypothetical protein
MSTQIPINRWEDKYSESLTEQAIRGHFVPSKMYRISRSEYQPGTRFPGSMRAGFVFVIHGSCSYSFQRENHTLRLTGGEYAETPAGHFTFEVLGTHAVEIVHVWRLPDEFAEVR